MKKTFLGNRAFSKTRLVLKKAAVLMFMISCAGAPKSTGTEAPVLETMPAEAGSVPVEASAPVAAPVEDASVETPVEASLDNADDSPADVIIEPSAIKPPADAATDTEAIELIEPVLAEALSEQTPPAGEEVLSDLLFVLPEPGVPVLPPLPPPVPEPEPEAVTQVLEPPLEPAAVPLAETEPEVSPPETAPPPEPAEEPPAIVREPVPRVIPELPRPTPAVTGLPDESMVFSRVVRATVGQLVEVPFRGTGWVYLGEAGSLRGIAYDSRRLDPEGQSFIFRTESAGTYALKFYRKDAVRDFILNDYVQVIVDEPAETAGTGWFGPPSGGSRVIAEPRWPTSLAAAQAARADKPSAQPATPPPAVQETPSTISPAADTPAIPPEPAALPATAPAPAVAAVPEIPSESSALPSALPPVEPSAIPEALPPVSGSNEALSSAAEYIDKAKTEYEAGRVASAMSLLNQFFERYPAGSDEALWLYGQFYEANSPSRNILAALDCYRRLVREYPQSGRLGDARRRIAYLERYYININ